MANLVSVIGVKVALRKYEKQVRQEVARSNINEILRQNIIGSIKKGKSPVEGFGRFEPYSQSYRDAIKGKAAFWTKNGKVRAAGTVSNKDLKSLRASKGARRQNASNRRFAKARAEQLFEGKKVSPVNMTLSGKMLKSFKIIRKIKRFSLTFILKFTDPKASYHNEGAKLWHGGELPERRLLPREGESLNRLILNRVRRVYQRITKRVAKRI